MPSKIGLEGGSLFETRGSEVEIYLGAELVILHLSVGETALT